MRLKFQFQTPQCLAHSLTLGIPNGFTLGSRINETVKSSDPIDRERMFAPKVKNI
jgi:hypothetical protein